MRSKKEEALLEKIEYMLKQDCCSMYKDTLIELSEAYKKTLSRLEKIIEQSDHQQQTLLELNEQLKNANKELEEKSEELKKTSFLKIHKFQ